VGVAVIAAASVEIEEALLLLKIGFLVLLYVFIWRIVRTASRDVRLPQESFILAPQQPRASSPAGGGGAPELVVLKSPALAPGARHALDSAALTLGRAAENDVSLADDDFASARHARIEPRRDGIWIEDVGSTNGTYVNGVRLKHPRKLAPGDVVRIGETDLRFEP
jgi:pSer/pThr/pTyr-binding forkhead associated (FHA) protein